MDIESSGSSPAKQSAIEWLSRWLVPGLLVLVALQHFYLVWAEDLTPWKGGGFGMFAVIDSVAMRTISGDCLDQQNRPCVLYLPFNGEERFIRGRRGNLMRAKRDPELLEQVADRLIESAWTPVSLHEIAGARDIAQALQQLPPDRASRPIYQLAAERDPTDARKEAVRLQAIRVQMWKLVYDAEQGVVRCEPWGDAVERGDWQ